MLKIRFSGILACLAILISDQWTKTWVLKWFTSHSGKLEIAPFLNLVLAWNKGISFSLFPANSSQGLWVLIGVAALLSLVILFWIWSAESRFYTMCFGMVLGGAIGNIIDRLRFGAVVDFIDFHLLGYHWYTFNIADCGIVIGAGLLLGHQFFFEKRSHR